MNCSCESGCENHLSVSSGDLGNNDNFSTSTDSIFHLLAISISNNETCKIKRLIDCINWKSNPQITTPTTRAPLSYAATNLKPGKLYSCVLHLHIHLSYGNEGQEESGRSRKGIASTFINPSKGKEESVSTGIGVEIGN